MDSAPDMAHEVAQGKIVFAQIVFEKPTFGIIKLSVLFFFRRIFTLAKFRKMNNWLIVLIVAWTIAFLFVDLFQCGSQIDANWDKSIKAQAHCINEFAMLLAFAVTEVITDMLILWTPYPQIRNLQLPKREKWALAGIFLLGTLDLMIGIVRLAFIIVTQTIPSEGSGFDALSQTAPSLWTVLEVGVGVCAVNLPALAPLYRKPSNIAVVFGLRQMPSKTSQTANTGEKLKRNLGAKLDDETRVGSEHDASDEVPDKHSSAMIGAWSQFERL